MRCRDCSTDEVSPCSLTRRWNKTRMRNGRQTVLFADLDNFKRWNEELGELGGDQILQSVAQALTEESRARDIVCRWGGEEFVIVLPNTDLEEGLLVAERIRRRVSELDTRIQHPGADEPVRIGHDTRPCTISIGVASRPAHGSELEFLVQQAVHAKKAAKDSGRNRVSIAVQGRSLADDGAK